MCLVCCRIVQQVTEPQMSPTSFVRDIVVIVSILQYLEYRVDHFEMSCSDFFSTRSTNFVMTESSGGTASGIPNDPLAWPKWLSRDLRNDAAVEISVKFKHEGGEENPNALSLVEMALNWCRCLILIYMRNSHLLTWLRILQSKLQKL